MATSKKDRQIIFNKFGGHCAYCGDELQKGWHIDEVLPVRRGWEYIKDQNGNRIWDANIGKYGDWKKLVTVMHPERFHIDNQMPACASCNINKHSNSIESFRLLIGGFIKSLNRDSTQYKIAKRYGLVEEKTKPIVFYFETFL